MALRSSTRTLALIEQYKESDYGSQFETPMYSIFEATIGNPIIKQLLGWDDFDYIANNAVNLERFFSWIS